MSGRTIVRRESLFWYDPATPPANHSEVWLMIQTEKLGPFVDQGYYEDGEDMGGCWVIAGGGADGGDRYRDKDVLGWADPAELRPPWLRGGGALVPTLVEAEPFSSASAETPGVQELVRAFKAELPAGIYDMEVSYLSDDSDINPERLFIRLGLNSDWYLAIGPDGRRPTSWVRVSTSGTKVPGFAVAIAAAFRAMGRTVLESEAGQRFLANLKGRRG